MGIKYQFDALSRVEYINLANINAAYVGYAFGCKNGNWIYLAPCYNAGYTANHGYAARYNTLKPFSDSSSWEFYDLVTNVDGNAKGFHGCISIGDYVYYIPLYQDVSTDPQTLNGHVVRYHETGASNSFTTAGNWAVYDMADMTQTYPLSLAGCSGYVGGTTDGTYLYLAPYGAQLSSIHGRMVRYNTTKAFNNSDSGWEVKDVAISALNTNLRGYHFACYDGSRYVYYSPFALNSVVYHGYVARFDKGVSGTNSFTDSANWDWVNLEGGGGNPPDPKGFYGCVKGDNYIYFANNVRGDAVRFDTTGTFRDSSHNPTTSWQYQDMDKDVINPMGYAGIDYGDDGYVYYAPDFVVPAVSPFPMHGTAVKCKADVTDWTPFGSDSSKSTGWDTVSGNTLFPSYFYMDLTKKNTYLRGSHGVIWTTVAAYFISIHSDQNVASGYISKHKFILDYPRSGF